MLWLLAVLGSMIELVEVPVVIWLVVTVIRYRDRLNKAEQAIRELGWQQDPDHPSAVG